MLLIPEIVELDACDKQRLLENAENLDQLGLSVEEFGPSAVIVREIPALIKDFQGAIALRQHGIDSLLEKFVPVMGRNHHSNNKE